MLHSENPSPSSVHPGELQATRWVVYRDVSDGRGYGTLFVFASVDLAVHLDAVYGALHEARTWGEFRRLLPASEWPALEERLFLHEDEVDDEDRMGWELDDTPFHSAHIRGIDESAYPLVSPEWLGDTDAFPDVLVTAHAQVTRDIYWQIPGECADTVAETLRAWGYVVERADFLAFC